jgi:hypothetical protein
MLRTLFAAGLVAGLLTLSAHADDKPKAKNPAEGLDAKMMEAWMKHATPGPAHKLLEPTIGSWTYTGQLWMEPGAPPTDMKGTGERKWILGGRFVQEEYKGTGLVPGQPFEGFGLSSYDNTKKKYVGVWADNMTTSFSLSEGTTDDGGKTFHFWREDLDPTTGKMTKGHDMIKIIDKDHHEMEMFKVEGGKEIKVMRLEYSRKK